MLTAESFQWTFSILQQLQQQNSICVRVCVTLHQTDTLAVPGLSSSKSSVLVDQVWVGGSPGTADVSVSDASITQTRSDRNVYSSDTN